MRAPRGRSERSLKKAEAAGRHLVGHAPEVVRSKVVTRFIEAFEGGPTRRVRGAAQTREGARECTGGGVTGRLPSSSLPSRGRERSQQ
jgi:hypothetical protein